MAGNIVSPEYKIILLGEVGVGKTSCFFRLRDNVFKDSQACLAVEHPVEHFEHTVLIDGAEVRATVYDTAGSERFRTLTSNYFLNSDAAILMFDIEDHCSFDELQSWYESAMKNIGNNENFVWALVGNKCDLGFSEIEPERISSRCQQLGTELMFSTSAKTGENVQEAFESVIREVHKKSLSRNYATAANYQSSSSRIKLSSHSGRSSSERKGCCK